MAPRTCPTIGIGGSTQANAGKNIIHNSSTYNSLVTTIKKENNKENNHAIQIN